MKLTEVESVLDLCRPPDGYQFVAGVWLAHDVNMEMVADTVAPILVRTPDRDREWQRRLAAQVEGDQELVIIGCAAQIEPGPPFPWTTFVRVGGRVQHAKCGVLQFAKPDSPKRVTRSFVTSANLTRPSLANRELLAWEEAGSQTSKATLARELLNVISRLTPQLQADDQPRVRALLRRLSAEGLPASTPTNSIVHSLDASRPLLTQFVGRHPRRADRVVIVGPPFAGDNDVAASHLLPWLGPGTQVNLYTGVDAVPGAVLGPERRPAFSRTILETLAAACRSKVQIWGVPSYDAESRRRWLHAKVIAIVHGQTAMVISGSANCTNRGLAGQNREMVIRQDWPLRRLEMWLSELEPIPYDGEVESPRKPEEPSEISGPLLEIIASFIPNDGEKSRSGRWHGRLLLDLPASTKGLRLSYRGVPIRIMREQDLELFEREAWLTGFSGALGSRIPITVEAPASFWEVGSDSDDDDDDPVLLALLRELRPSGARSEVHQPTDSVSFKVARTDDRYRIAPEQALAMVARRRTQLRMRLAGGLGPDGEALFPNEVERRIAEALLGQPSDRSTTLLASLSAALVDFDVIND
jgi:hypothetical protein